MQNTYKLIFRLPAESTVTKWIWSSILICLGTQRPIFTELVEQEGLAHMDWLYHLLQRGKKWKNWRELVARLAETSQLYLVSETDIHFIFSCLSLMNSDSLDHTWKYFSNEFDRKLDVRTIHLVFFYVFLIQYILYF